MGLHTAAPILIAFFALLCASTAPASPPIALDDENQRLMAVAFDDGTSVSDALIAYEISQTWFLPLGELSQGLNLALQVSPGIGAAEGFVLQEHRRFKLDVANCRVEYAGSSEQFDCAKAIVSDDEIFVEASLYERWFPLKIQVDPFASQIIIRGKEKFPAQLRKERERQAQAFSTLNGKYDPGYPRVTIPRNDIDVPVVDQQLSFRHKELNNRAQNSLRHDTSVAGEVLGLEASGFIGGTQEELDQTRLSLSRHDPDGGLLGPLNAREIQLMDFTLPSLPLIGGGVLGRGAMVSSYPLYQPTNYSFRDFRGDLPAGWEVELYQNDILISRQFSSDGLYEFAQIPLLYGLNRFRLAFYGPQGQRRESFETFNITSSMMQPKTRDYRIALANIDSGHNRAIVQFDQSVGDNITLRTGFAHLTPLKEKVPQSYGFLGANGYLGRTLLTLSNAVTERGGQATEVGAQVPLNLSSIGTRYTHLTKFTSDLFNAEGGLILRDMVEATGAFNLFSFPATRMTFDLARKFYDTGEVSTALTQRTSVNTGPVHWFNTITAESAPAKIFAGQLTALTVLGRTEIRLISDYEKEIKTAGLATQTRLTDRLSIGADVQQSILDSLTQYQLTLNRHFGSLTLSADAAASSDGNFSVGALLSYSLMMDPAKKSIYVDGRAQGSHGAASVFVFFDRNQNGVADPDENAIEGVEILVNLQESGFVTDATGHVLLRQLPVHQPVDLSISLKSLEDPVHKPSPRGVRIIPRPGKCAHLELPVVALSDLDGSVRIESKGRLVGKRSIEVQLIDQNHRVLKSVKTEPDGFFLFESVPAGEYRVQLNPVQLEAAGLVAQPNQHSIVIAPEGFSGNAMDFLLRAVDVTTDDAR